jgi:hypothetical protein
VGAGVAGGAVWAGIGGACFFLQPAIENRATTRTAGAKICLKRFNVLSFCELKRVGRNLSSISRAEPQLTTMRSGVPGSDLHAQQPASAN